MSDFYQIPLDLPRTDPEYLRWEKLNFILRQIQTRIDNSDGRQGPLSFQNKLNMEGYQIENGPIMTTAKETDYVTKSWFRTAEFGRMAAALLASAGKTPLSIQGSTGTPSSGGGGGGGGTSDHSALLNLSYATAGHTGFVPATRAINTTSPITGGGDLSADRTIAITGSSLTEVTSSVLTITGGSAAVLSATTIQVKQASAGQSGYLSSGDWSTFNAKVGGSGTIGNIPKFSAASTLTDSVIKEASGKIGIGTSGAPSYPLEVAGQVKATDGSILPTVKTFSIAAGAIATDASLGNHFRGTLTQSVTLSNPTGAVDGQRIIWEFLQDGTGGWQVTLGSKFVVPYNIPDIILAAVAGKYDMIGAIYNSTLDKWIVTGFMKEYS